MARAALLLAVLACCVGAGPARHGGGTPYALVAGQGSLWLLTCDRGCSGEARHAVGRILRIDPRTSGVVGAAVVRRPQAIAIGAQGVYSLDFWRNRVQLLDPRRLTVVRTLKLRLPFRFSPRDNAFRPLALAVGRNAVWITTARGALARADLQLHRVRARVRLPFDNPATLAVAPHAIWLPQGLAGVYGIDARTNRIVARIRVSLTPDRFDAEQAIVCGGNVLVVGAAVRAALTNREHLVRVRERARVLGRLPAGPLAFTCGAASLWLGRQGGSSLERIDPSTGKVLEHRRAKVGVALAFAGGRLWTAFPDGTVRQLGR